MEYRQTPLPNFDNPICQKCALHTQGCKSGKMPGDGNPQPLILFIAEAPGEVEDRYNRVLVGPTGSLLRATLKELGIDESQCRFTNTVRCRPPGNRTPKANEIKYCRQFLEEEIAQTKPKVIVLLGNSPLKAVLGETGISAFNGTVIKRDGVTYVPAYHPSFIARNGVQGESLDEWLTALMNAKAASEDAVTDLDYTITVPETLDEVYEGFRRIRQLHKETGHNIAYDVETRWLYPDKPGNTILMFSLAVGSESIVIPLHHTESWWTKEEKELIWIELEDTLKQYPITGHNVRFDQKATRVLLGIDFTPAGDTLNISRLLRAHDKAHGLKRLAAVELNLFDYDKGLKDYQAEHPAADPSKGGDFGLVPLDILLEYSGLDTIACSLIESKLLPQLTPKQRILYDQMIQPASDVLGRLEQNGFYVDRVLAKRYATVYQATRDRYYRKLIDDPDVAWYIEFKLKENKKFAFNPASDFQMRDIIFGVKDYKPINTTATGLPSVSWDSIKEYKDAEPFFKDFRMWNLMNDMLSKYLLPPVNGDWFFGTDDRCRVNFNLGGAASGRLSSSQPTNLQNIPTSEKEYGTLLMYKPIKNIFTASAWADRPTHPYKGTILDLPEWTVWNDKDNLWEKVERGPLHPYREYPFPIQRGRLCKFDFNGQELRVMASIANVPGMISAFNEGRDIHSFVTSLLFGIPEHLVKSEYNHMRYRAKWVNWTLLYGGDEHTLYNLYQLPLEEAKELMKKYYGVFPEILDFQKTVKRFVAENGYVESILGRKLRLHYTTPEDRQYRQAMYNKDMRTAVNFPIQGTASDMLLLAMIVIQDQLRQGGYRSIMVNTVHDSVVVDTPIDEVDDIKDLCVTVMENLPALGKTYFPDIDLSWLRVNLKADCDVGIYYGSK